MTQSKRRGIEIFSMSFLDAISCGFGAMILLLIITMASEPRTIRQITVDLRDKIAEVESERKSLAGEDPESSRRLAEKQNQLRVARRRLAELRKQQSIAEGRSAEVQRLAEERTRVESELKAVQQNLTEEMKRLLAKRVLATAKPRELVPDSPVGGIPVDREYIIFLIDTSGSMLKVAWPLVIKKVEEVLNVHPQVKGIQIMSDMGAYMYSQYAGTWIPDSPARRKAVISRLSSWRTFSNSSPVEGILHTVQHYFREDRHVSLYIFGDDFSTGTVDDVLAEVASINRRDASGSPRVRIHAFGFPVLFLDERGKPNRTRFANLMRLLAERNEGSFVGLNSVR
jgi:hypothetical protein